MELILSELSKLLKDTQNINQEKQVYVIRVISRDEAEKVERSITAKEDIALSRINDCGNFTLIKEIEFVESATLEALASGNEFNSMFSEEEIYRLKNSSIDRTIYSLVKQKITVNDDEKAF